MMNRLSTASLEHLSQRERNAIATACLSCVRKGNDDVEWLRRGIELGGVSCCLRVIL